MPAVPGKVQKQYAQFFQRITTGAEKAFAHWLHAV
jgi:hypothetical protein